MRGTPTLRQILLCAPLLLGALACQPKEVTSAKIYMQNNDWDSALQQLEKAVASEPKNAEAHLLLGQIYARRGRFDKMNRHFAAAIEFTDLYLTQTTAVREQYWIEHYTTGVRALDRGNYGRAKSDLETAILIDSSKTDAYRKLARTYLNQDRPKRALSLYKGLIERHPHDIDILMSTANLYYTQRDFAEVIPVLRKILDLAPGHRDALANLALSYDSLGEPEKALAAYRAAIAANPNDPGLMFLLAVHHFKRHRFQQAIMLFQQALVLAPNDFDALSNIGNAYLSLAEKIRRDLKTKRAKKDQTLDPLTLKQKAILNYQRAIPYLEKSLDLQPQNAALWRNLAAAYVYTGKKEQGERAFVKAEELASRKGN